MASALRSAATTLLLAAAAASTAQAQTDLPIGSETSLSATDMAPATLRFAAPGAGVLTVAVQGGGDLTLSVTDEDGQLVREGTADYDRDGDTGRETLSVVLTNAGEYRVVVRQLDSMPQSLRIGGSWLPFPAFERPADPDGRPGQARALGVDSPIEDTLDSAAGDDRDWFTVRPSAAGSLVIITRLLPGEEGDLMLEAWVGSVSDEPLAHSDQDLQGDTGHESLTLNVNAGDVVLVKVGAALQSTPRVGYRLSSSLVR